MQGSDVGYPSSRHNASGKRCTGVRLCPALCSADHADDGSPLAHRTEVPAELCTTTVTPFVLEQAAAWAGAAVTTSAEPPTVTAATTARNRWTLLMRAVRDAGVT